MRPSRSLHNVSKADDLFEWLLAELRRYQRSGEPLYTLGRRQPNWIRRVDRDGVWVETKQSSRNPRLIERQWLRDSIEELLAQRMIVAEMLPGSARFRSAFILTALSLLPGATQGGSPPSVTLRDG